MAKNKFWDEFTVGEIDYLQERVSKWPFVLKIVQKLIAKAIEQGKRIGELEDALDQRDEEVRG